MSIPPPVNEPVREYAPGSPERASHPGRARPMLARAARAAPVIGGQDVTTGDAARGARAARPPARPRPLARGGRAEVERGHRRRRSRRTREWAALTLEQRAARVPARRRPARRAVARRRSTPPRCSASRRRSYQAEIDAACELVDFCASTRTSPSRSTPSSRSRPRGAVEPHRLPAARGLRASRSRRSTSPSIGGNLPTRAGADGQRRGLEAGLDRDPRRRTCMMRLLQAAGLPDGVINFVARRRRPTIREACSTHPDLRRHPLHRLDRRLPAHVADRRREHRPLPQLPAPRRRDRRQGLHLRPRLAPTSRRSPSAIVRGGFEYQGQKCSAASRALRARARCGGAVRERRRRR